MFECECGKEFLNKSGYVTHRKYCSETDVEINKTYNCVCEAKFNSKSGLISHKRWCSEADRMPPERNYVNCSLCNQKIDSRNIKSHENSRKCKRIQLKNERIENGKLCENCEENEVKDFGESSTGRFCSKKCARSYATQNNRKEISKKVSEKLSGRVYKEKREGYYKNCPICEEEFYTSKKDDQIFCSRECYLEDLGNYNYMKKPSGGGGYRENSTIKHSCEYQGQRMDSGAELRFAKLLDEKGINWNKNEQDKFFKYEGINGKGRKYYPDFYLENFDFWVEIKSKYYQTENLDRKINSVSNIELVYIDEIEDFVEDL